MKLITSLSIAALMCGCNRNLGDSYHVIISHKFSSDQATTIQSALDSWEAALYGRLSLDREISDQCDFLEDRKGISDADYTICIVPSTTEHATEVCERDSVACTHSDWNSGSSTVYIGMNNPKLWATRFGFQQAIAHEFGHALGLGHTDLGTIMYPYVIGKPTITPTCNDVDQYFSIRNEVASCR